MGNQFRGIWIPAEMWLDNNLTLQEKLFLAEIVGLEGEKGCFASNAWFANFFSLSKGRVSKIISSIESKGYVSVELIKDKKQIIGRRIHTKINYRPVETKDFNIEIFKKQVGKVGEGFTDVTKNDFVEYVAEYDRIIGMIPLSTENVEECLMKFDECELKDILTEYTTEHIERCATELKKPTLRATLNDEVVDKTLLRLS